MDANKVGGKSKKCVVICGPTASGKTSLAIRLAGSYKGAVVSADSMQIYRGMDIGTAKPTSEEQKAVRHELIDIRSPDESFSAARYKLLACDLITKLNGENVLPFIVGGTGLYIDSVIFNNLYAQVPDSPELREILNKEYDAEGGEAMLRRLAETDPGAAAKLHPADKKRIVRALEIYSLTGKTLTEFNALSRQTASDTDFLIFVLWFSDRDELYGRINSRVDKMLEKGLEEEARRLWKDGFSRFPTASQAIGYKELFKYFDGEITFDEAVELIKRRSRNYAKRQMTWFRRYSALGAIFVEAGDPASLRDAEKKVGEFVPDRFCK